MGKVWFDPKKGEFPKIEEGSYGVEKWIEYQQEDIYQIPIEEHFCIKVYALLEDPSTPVIVFYNDNGRFTDYNEKWGEVDVTDMILCWRYLPKPPKDLL